jgi:trehalose synthase-fused probable maltokinase
MRGAELALALDEAALGEWLLGRRWFASKARDVAQVHVLDAVVLHEGDPALVVACVEARFQAGTHELYQLLLGLRPVEAGWTQDVVAEVDGTTVYDAPADPQVGTVLARLLREEAAVQGANARVEFHWLEGVPPPAAEPDVRAMDAEQSNSSLVFDRALVLKAFRRLEAGVNPELEMLRFLSARGFANVAELGGWYEYSGELMDATFGVVQRFVEGGRDGWELALEQLERDPEAFLGRLRELGEVIAQMHTVLGSDVSDPAFAPEEPGEETLSLLTATIDEQIEQVFLDLPHDAPDVEPIVGRGEEVRDRLRLLSKLGAGGKVIRHHGDLHLGQTLLAPIGWVILDFEGEPARPLIERRRKRSPLRDVAGMLRSFAYAASASELQNDVRAPEGWEERARSEFLAGYLDTVDQTLLPHGENAARTLLSIFELEKAVYELRYELNNRPDWVRIPAAGIARLLEEEM